MGKEIWIQYVSFAKLASVDPLQLKDLPQFRIVQPLNASYSFSSLSTSLKIISGDARETSIGCIQVEVTPALGSSISAVLRFVPLGILLLVGFGTIIAAIFNPWNGTTDIFRWSSNYGMDQDMLRLVTPGFGDCLQYLQFAVLTGALTLNYPGFFQPALSRVGWSVLLFNSSIVSQNSHTRLIDNVYASNGTLGIENLSQLIGLGGVEDVWPISFVVFAGLLGGICVVIAGAAWFRWVKMRISKQQEEDLRSKTWPFIGGKSALQFTLDAELILFRHGDPHHVQLLPSPSDYVFGLSVGCRKRLPSRMLSYCGISPGISYSWGRSLPQED